MEIPRNWRLRGPRLRLEGEVCRKGHTVFPPRDICPTCTQEAKTIVRLSGQGEIYSHTTLFEPAEQYVHLAPLTLAIIQLTEGPRITAPLTDINRVIKEDGSITLTDVFGNPVDIGTKVEVVIRRLSEGGPRGVIDYRPAFRPTLTPR